MGNRPVLELIDFEAGTEAVTAKYDAGKLLIVEYLTPQGSVDADNKIKQKLAEEQDSQIFYRRIGNYNAFVFDGNDKTAAKALLDQVKYEKEIQWLGYNPFAIQKIREERKKQKEPLYFKLQIFFCNSASYCQRTRTFGNTRNYRRNNLFLQT